jgi:hypothetical protein
MNMFSPGQRTVMLANWNTVRNTPTRAPVRPPTTGAPVRPPTTGAPVPTAPSPTLAPVGSPV